MFNLFNKKEAPLLGLQGSGGGLGFLTGGGGGVEASGGNVNGTLASGSKYHIFTADGTFNVTAGGSVSILAIAGGGGGGVQHGGGGGAGALYFNEILELDAGTYSITIGNGGTGGPAHSDNSANGSNTIFGPGTPQHIVLNGGGRGRKMNQPNTTLMPGGSGGCGGGGGMTPLHPSPPVRQAGGTVTTPSTHPLSSPFIFGNAGGRGTDYNSGGRSGGGGGGCGPDGGPGSNEVPNTNPQGRASSGGDDFICPSGFLPTPAIPTLGAALGTPTKFLGVPNPQPNDYRRAFGGGGAAGSHSPWGIYNPSGEYPDGGGGTNNRTGGVGGTGNTDAGGAGLDNRGAGGGGSGSSGAVGGDGGNGVIIIKY
jgi:hypothetical protein